MPVTSYGRIESGLEDIVKSINDLKAPFARTLDNIPAFFLKEVASTILQVLIHLFNLTLSTAIIPCQWKKVP